jgi:hypothetical protein
MIANGTTLGKGNITYTAVSKQGGIILDSDRGYIKAKGNVNLMAYSGSSGGEGIYIYEDGLSLTAADGGIIRSETGDIIFSAYSANNVGLRMRNDNTNIVALEGDIIVQGASLSTNTNDNYSTANTAIDNTYSAIYTAITTASNPRTYTPLGFVTGNSSKAAKGKNWGGLFRRREPSSHKQSLCIFK